MAKESLNGSATLFANAVSALFDEAFEKARVGLREDMQTELGSMEGRLNHRIDETKEELTQHFDGQIKATKEELTQHFDGQIKATKEELTQHFDGQIKATKEELTQHFDGQIKTTNENMQAQFARQEQMIANQGKAIADLRIEVTDIRTDMRKS